MMMGKKKKTNEDKNDGVDDNDGMTDWLGICQL